jgi:hypothetical protein
VVKYLVAIEMPRVRFPDGAFLLPLSESFLLNCTLLTTAIIGIIYIIFPFYSAMWSQNTRKRFSPDTNLLSLALKSFSASERGDTTGVSFLPVAFRLLIRVEHLHKIARVVIMKVHMTGNKLGSPDYQPQSPAVPVRLGKEKAARGGQNG